jgi:hypothetical protein
MVASRLLSIRVSGSRGSAAPVYGWFTEGALHAGLRRDGEHGYGGAEGDGNSDRGQYDCAGGLRRYGEHRHGGAGREGNSDCGQDDCAFHA